MTAKVEKVLLIGYGNPGRLDDGLGPALAEVIEAENIPGVTVDANYQLSVEDAAAVAEHDVVIFADASVNATEPFSFTQIHPKSNTLSFSSHSVEPEAVIALAQELFKADTVGYALGIRGYEFNEFGQKISTQAKENLEKAIEFIVPALRKKIFQ
ncbi:MAG: hydrogenase maturation protease [PVC group bacterium]|nr:hydrogenase maturation protease [PVC group bacterium]